LQGLLRGLGYQSEIFCERRPLHFDGHAQQITEYVPSAEHVFLLHFSLGYSHEVMTWIRRLPGRKVLVYHNITPPSYFAGINDVYFEAARAGREQLDALRTVTEAAWGDSSYNCRELAERGWNHVGVLPIIFDFRRYAARPDRKVFTRCSGSPNILFVGRTSPNKCFKDLILTFYYLKRHVRPDARLLLVGSAHGMEVYLEFLQALVRALGLSDVVFAGHVSDSELMAYYRCADVYLSMSDHEGFGVPLLESMHFGVPIVAYKAAAVPETLDDSGILVTEKDHPVIAELIGLLLEDAELRDRLVARQRERLKSFTPERVGERLQALLHSLGL
jgi:glycosyltransferase involved in cell wall biosynthesis